MRKRSGGPAAPTERPRSNEAPSAKRGGKSNQQLHESFSGLIGGVEVVAREGLYAAAGVLGQDAQDF